jgi:hypothetical protein
MEKNTMRCKIRKEVYEAVLAVVALVAILIALFAVFFSVMYAIGWAAVDIFGLPMGESMTRVDVGFGVIAVSLIIALLILGALAVFSIIVSPVDSKIRILDCKEDSDGTKEA